MKIGDREILLLFALLDRRELGGYLPLPVLRQITGLPTGEAKVVALSLEKAGLIECTVDERLAEDAKYKCALTPAGMAFMQEILHTPQKKGIIHKARTPK